MGNDSPAEGAAEARFDAASERPTLTSDTLLILPVRESVLFPGVLFPISISRPFSIAAVQQAMREQRPIGVLMQRDSEAAERAVLAGSDPARADVEVALRSAEVAIRVRARD